jgi:hypothetical protein
MLIKEENLPPTEQFRYLDCVIGGDECWLINPIDIKCRWNNDNLIFRSLILRKSDLKVINSSWKKFFNWSEQPDIEPFSYGKFSARAKHDGSTLILGVHNGEVIQRTRGTVSVLSLENGDEIYELQKKYPKVWEAIHSYSKYSLIFEWETPTNYIVLRRVTEPTLVLTGMINNETLEYVSQLVLDFAADSWGVERPKHYEFSTVEDCIKDVELWENAEGVVLYSECGQRFRKIKASLYCRLHKILSGMKSTGNVLDVFMESPKFENGKDFYKFMETTLDYEVAEYCKDSIEDICEAYRNVIVQKKEVEDLVNSLGKDTTRKDQAMEIQKHLKDWCVGYAFSRLDGKEMDDKTLRKAMVSNIGI